MSSEPEYKLYYWPGFPGRGEYMRLLFAETETPYSDVFAGMSFEEAMKMGKGKGRKLFAMPAIEHGDLFISQSAVICRYLGKKLDGGRLYPKTEKDQIRAEVLMAGVVDVVEEGCRYWHPIDYNASYESQKEEAKPFIEYYKTKRLPKWLDFFETALKENYSKSGKMVFVGDQISWVDFCIFHFLDGNLFSIPEVFAQEETTHLDQFYQQIRERPNIKKWLNSDKRTQFSNTGPIF